MDTTVKGGSFLYRAVVADLVLYGLGHHFPRLIDRADKMGAGEQLEARRAFFMRNLNHTLASTVAHRAAAGHHPSTVTLLGASTPVSGCSRHTRPISLTESLASGAEEQPTNQYTQRWHMMPRFDQVARWLAADAGARFLDVAKLSAQRPDAAMARYMPNAGALDEDCLHFCMPGPVDTWVRLLHNLWSRPSMRAALDASGGRGRPGPFFALNTTRWLGERSAGHSVEGGCNRRAAEPRKRCIDSIVSRHWWWPFANHTRRPKAAKAAGAAGKGAKGKKRSKGRRRR